MDTQACHDEVAICHVTSISNLGNGTGKEAEEKNHKPPKFYVHGYQ